MAILPSPATSNDARDVILIPVFNDWESLTLLVPELDRSLAATSPPVDLIVVDDGSTPQLGKLRITEPLRAVSSIDVLTLARNLGHQRAIAIGLSYIAMRRPCRAVVVMDADGEDLPGDVPRLLAAFEEAGRTRVIFAKRTRRSEGVVFALFYRLYRIAHLLLTGIRVEVGNFSVVPYPVVRKLAVVSEMWNHYAAAVVHARIPTTLVPTVRGKRLTGRPTMNFVPLAAHGLSAMSVFADRIGVRLLVTTGLLMTSLIAALIAAVFLRAFTDVVIPVWAAVTLGFVAILLVQTAILSMVFMFMIQMGRAGSSFIPAREYELFVESVKRVWERSE